MFTRSLFVPPRLISGLLSGFALLAGCAAPPPPVPAGGPTDPQAAETPPPPHSPTLDLPGPASRPSADGPSTELKSEPNERLGHDHRGEP